jgi:hypothetical protein
LTEIKASNSPEVFLSISRLTLRQAYGPKCEIAGQLLDFTINWLFFQGLRKCLRKNYFKVVYLSKCILSSTYFRKMRNKNFDITKKRETKISKAKVRTPRVSVEKPRPRAYYLQKSLVGFLKGVHKRPVFITTAWGMAVAMLMLGSFVGGGWLVWSARSSIAENQNNQGRVLGTSASEEAPIVGPVLPAAPVDLNDFVDTSIKLLNDYLEVPATEEQLLVRREKLQKYLEFKKSPFAKDPAALDTLVHVPHMKIILEIAFAESSLGKKCADNNCSNIGSAPGRPYWHEYKSLSNWILDFNRLLDRRYQDWSLKQMCGVYVKPCTDSWLAATGQVRRELQEWGIE